MDWCILWGRCVVVSSFWKNSRTWIFVCLLHTCKCRAPRCAQFNARSTQWKTTCTFTKAKQLRTFLMVAMQQIMVGYVDQCKTTMPIPGVWLGKVSRVPYSRKFSLVQIFAEMHPYPSEEIFAELWGISSTSSDLFCWVGSRNETMLSSGKGWEGVKRSKITTTPAFFKPHQNVWLHDKIGLDYTHITHIYIHATHIHTPS